VRVVLKAIHKVKRRLANGETLDELPYPIGLLFYEAGLDRQQPAIELEHPLEQRRGVGWGEFDLRGPGVRYEVVRDPGFKAFRPREFCGADQSHLGVSRLSDPPRRIKQADRSLTSVAQHDQNRSTCFPRATRQEKRTGRGIDRRPPAAFYAKVAGDRTRESTGDDQITL